MSSKRKPKPKPTRRPRRRRRLLVVLAIAIPLALLALTAAGGAVYFGSSCDLSTLQPVRQADSSLVYGANGSLIGVLPAVENRTAVVRNAIGAWMPKATVAIEDRRFYQHGGIDPEGILRAFVADVSAGHIVQGGSTITQELVRNLYLSRDKTVQRKVVEACLAVKLARAWTKDRILTAYLNDVYYGNHAYGIQAAAETYFSVPASRLTLGTGGAPRRAAAGSFLLRPAAQPGRSTGPARRGSASVATERGHHRGAVRGGRSRSLPPPPPELRVCEPGAVLRRIRREPARAGVRRCDRSRGRAEDLHDDPAAPAAGCGGRVVSRALCAPRSLRRDRLDRSRDRRDSCDGRREPRGEWQRVQPRHGGRATGRVDVQAHRPRCRGRARDEPVGDALSLCAVLLRAAPVERPDVRRHVRRARDRRRGDDPLRQHRLRAARARCRPGGDRGDGEEARRADAAAADAVPRPRHRLR